MRGGKLDDDVALSGLVSVVAGSIEGFVVLNNLENQLLICFKSRLFIQLKALKYFWT